LGFRQMRSRDLSSDSNAQKILLVGDVDSAILDFDAIGEFPFQISTNMLDAIDIASKNNFVAIAVVMSGSSSRLSLALKALRDINPDAKIILLAHMYEEPAAMKLIGMAANGKNVADGYLICPIEAKRLREFIEPADSLSRTMSGAVVNIDAAMKNKVEQLEKLATEDELTGLKNRRYTWEFARQIIEHARQENGRVTLLIFDIDDFKHYNDVYGHTAGDEILQQAAILMQRSCRQHDIVGRIGGDEFAVVFWDDPLIKPAGTETERRTLADHPKEAIFIAKRFRRELKKAKLDSLGPEGKGVLAISGGLASFPRDGSTIQELFAQADNALLDAKRSGKNRIYLVGGPKSDIADIE